MKDMRIKSEGASDEDEDGDTIELLVPREEAAPTPGQASPIRRESVPRISPLKTESQESTPREPKAEHEEIIAGQITVKMEPGQPPKLARSSSSKIVPRAPQLFADYENKTGQAKSTFEVLNHCTYAAKYLGSTEHAMECDCSEEWGKHL